MAIIGCAMMLEGSTLIMKKTKWVENISSKTIIIYIVTASIFTYVPQLMSRAGVKVVLGSIPAVLLDIAVLIPVSLGNRTSIHGLKRICNRWAYSSIHMLKMLIIACTVEGEYSSDSMSAACCTSFCVRS